MLKLSNNEPSKFDMSHPDNGFRRNVRWMARNLGTLLDSAFSSNRRAIAALILASSIAFVPGIFRIPPIDRDEPNIAQSTKQMIESGDYVDIRFQGTMHYTKPVGIYWLQAAIVRTAEALGVPDARSTIWLYRLPSLLGAIGAVLLTYWCALAFVGKRAAAMAALMVAASPVLAVEARLARTDTMLLLSIVTAMTVLARAYLSSDDKNMQPGKPLVAAFWTAIAAGILLKGLVIIMVVGLTAATLTIINRSLRWLTALYPTWGIAWLITLVLPWFVAIYVRTGNTFLLNSVVHDTLGKIGNSQESHGAPPGYYVALFFVTFFPGSVIAILAAPAIWAKRSAPGVRFLLAWLIPAWIVFELSVTKLPHYVLPLYPAIAILVAVTVQDEALPPQRWLKWGGAVWFFAPLLISAAIIALAIVADHNSFLLAWPLLAGACFLGFLAWQACESAGVERSITLAVASVVITGIAVYAVVVPALVSLFPSAALAGVLRDSGCKTPIAASVGYNEPSLVFLAGTDTRFTDASGAVEFLRNGACRFAFIESHQLTNFVERAKAAGLRYERSSRIDGFNFTKGRKVVISIFRSADDS